MIDSLQTGLVAAILGAAIFSGWLFAPYVVRVYRREPTRLDRIFDPLENLVYRLVGADPDHGMGWKEYFLAAVLVNVVQMGIAAIILLFQSALPLDPQGFPGLSWDLTFNTVVSMATNTNLQHYDGAATLSYLSQISAIQFLQFTSAATGISAAVAFARGLTSGSNDMGNFYVDFVRSLTRILLPLCFVAALVFVALGVPQTLGGYVTVKTVEGAAQTILVGPVASLVSIMQVGTNGGGYFSANSAYPFQNPNPQSDLLEMFLMLLLPTTLCFVYGRMLGKNRETRPILLGAYCLLAIDLIIAFVPTSTLTTGMEVRFGNFLSVFWTVVTTAATTGSVNSSLSGEHPLVILAAFMGMLTQSGPGAMGVGLMYMVMYVVMTVFIVGLMSGRTPEYLGFKIGSRDVLLVMGVFIIHPLIILLPTLLAYATGAVTAIGVGAGSLGFTEILYEYASAAANNGSDFLGSSANTVFFNVSTGIVILVGRYAPLCLLLALSGSVMGRKRSLEPGLKTDSLLFTAVLVVSILVMVVLTFFPFLVLGPILSYFQGNVNGVG